ncbi:MAG: hypothetical protein M0P61_05515 [Ignavibacteriaceae bacterium]|jgi:hypothetical protein|nr:hypothetical protein [Ignavibacteriaceae bacterium]
MKKLIISILIPSLLLSLCGCYSTKEISKDEFIKPDSKKEILKQDPEQETFLITNDSTRYQLFKFSYNANGDTIILKGTKSITKENIIPFSGEIAVSDVKNFEVLAKDEINTTLLTWGIIVGAVLIVFVVALLFDHSGPNLSGLGDL